jgi:superfamily I DNA/RNA helicase
MTTFETKEVYEALLKAVSGKVKTSFKEELEKVRTNKKAHFTMLSEKIKMSTIYSYKGWDASCVILLILTPPPHPDALENRPELIYTAITRASDYLYVINLGNQTYHGFFQQHI